MNSSYSISKRIAIVLWSGILAMLITVIAGSTWSALVAYNLATNPSIPWSVVPMGFLIWLMWKYLGGKWWPKATSEARSLLLRANPVSPKIFLWSFFAGILSIVALAAYWIVMFQLVAMPLNNLPDMSPYPLLTVVLMIAMGSLVAPFSEEAAFRGYCQVKLERQFPWYAAVILSSAFFALFHGPTQGFLLPKLFVYFLVGITFGVMAHLTNSLWPGIAVHVVGLASFFALIWPNDKYRVLVRNGGADVWFYLHVAQAVIFTALAIFTFKHLARIIKHERSVENERQPHASTTTGTS